MKLNELKAPLTAQALNETLAKTFGKKIALEKFTTEQLEDARNKLRTQLSQVEMSEKFETVNKSDTYQKAKLFLDVINAEMTEREKAKPDFLDMDKDGDKKEPMKKAVKDKKANDELSAKQKKLPAGLQKAIAKKQGDKADDKEDVKEGAEEQATLTMAAKDMVDRITGWMEDTAEMQTESMLELGDKIRDELGSEKSEQFIGTVKPALEQLYTTFETTREALSNGVAIVTGEGGPEMMPGDDAEAEAPAEEPAMEPTVDQEADAEAPVEDEFAASEPATGGEETADRGKRESILRSRRLGQLLTDSKKKASQ
jgi:hypothetical protein